MSLVYRHNVSFQEASEPRLRKNIFGMDEWTVVQKGGQPHLESFLNGLSQGQRFRGLYLQEWNSNDDAVFPEVTLSYRGLLNDRIPEPRVVTGGTIASATKTVEAVGDWARAVREVTYFTVQTTYFYVHRGRPAGSVHTRSASSEPPRILRSKVTATPEGENPVDRIFTGLVPADLASALSMQQVAQVVTSSAEPVIGSPYFECSDVVAVNFRGD